jgi:hypothetical protein
VPIETEFLELMPTTVTVFAPTTTDAYGKQSFAATGTEVRCRLQPSDEVMKDADNREVVAKGTIIFFGTPAVTTQSRILLPDNTVPLVLSVRVHNDDTGTHHTTVVYT